MKTRNRMHHLGKLRGPLLLFGGVYSNFQALEALIQVAAAKGIPSSQMICTGDVVAYCAQPEESVQKMQELGIRSIAGNVEIQLREGLADCACDFVDGGRCDSFSKKWYPYSQQQLSQNSIDWMKTLPEFIQFEYAGKNVLLVHGSYHYTSEFIFQSTPWEVKQQNFDDSGANVIVAGHAGLPFSQLQQGKYWLNPGVIGMPANDGTPQVWYMILDDQNGIFSYQHLPLSYNHKLASNLMIEQNLTTAYAKTLQTGIWDNCEILPQEETALQGQKIVFDPAVISS